MVGPPRWLKRRPVLIACVAACLTLSTSPVPPDSEAGLLPPAPADDGTPRLVVDPSNTHQQITGWEATAQAGHQDSAAYSAYRDKLLDAAIDDLGINRLRLEIASGVENSRDYWSALRAGQLDRNTWRAVRYATVNDNDDPFSANDAGFHFTSFDDTVEQVVLPMKQRLEARGRRLRINVTYVAFTRQIGAGLKYVHQDPEEYAEFAQVTYRHLHDKYGLIPDSWEIQLEPDQSSQWTPSLMRRVMIATGNRLQAMGVTPRFVAPSTTNMTGALTYVDGIAGGGAPRFWAELSYHRYAGVSERALQLIAARAQQLRIATAMLEHIGSSYEDLHEDLKTGQNSAWQQFTLAFPGALDDGGAYYLIDDRDVAAPRMAVGSRTAFLSQYFRYIHDGAVRIDAATSDSAFDPLAFVNPDGKSVVVVKASKSGTFTVEGLKPDAYAATYTTARQADVREELSALRTNGSLHCTIPGAGVLTIYAQ